MNLRERCQQVYLSTRQIGIKSVRAWGQATNLSKSSVHRLRKRIKNRNQYPESDFWETLEDINGCAPLYLLLSIYLVSNKELGQKYYLSFFIYYV